MKKAFTAARPDPRPYPRVAAAITLSLACATPALAAQKAALPAPPANGEMGFVLTAFHPSIYQGKDDCPDGLAGTVKENFLETQPAAERARLLLKENEKELTQKWQVSVLGPNSVNICSNPELFERPIQKTLQGKVAYGLDLDGDTSGRGSASSAPHVNFTSPDGLRGVDNESYRAMGCTRNYRGVDGMGGDVVRGYDMYLATGEHSMVMLLRGVDSLEHDDAVEVIFATTGDRPILDGKMNFIHDASYSVSDNPRWRTVLKGRIDKGVLTTQPADVRLTRKLGHGGIRGERSEWDLREARFSVAFQPDGSFKGVLGAYQPARNIIESAILGGIGAATAAGIDCAAHYRTLEKLADGVRDPQTGKFTALSTALTVEAVPAFVTDTPPATEAKTVADAR
ncbi:MAG TPA: hypothetical protein VF475_15360 [Sphingobium sp.]